MFKKNIPCLPNIDLRSLFLLSVLFVSAACSQEVPFTDLSNAVVIEKPAVRIGETSLETANKDLETKPIESVYGSKLMDQRDIDAFPLRVDRDSQYYRFSGTYTESLTSDHLIIRTSVNVWEAGEYNFYGYLADDNGQVFLESDAKFTAVSGDNRVEMRFDLRQMKTHGVNGAFTLKGVNLFYDGHFAAEKYGDLYTTQSYNLDGVQPVPALFTGKNFSDRGIDTNGNGLFEKIELNVEIELAKAGTYTIKAMAGYAWGEVTKQLSAGKNIVPITLDLHGVVAARDRNPLVLKILSAYDDQGNLIAESLPRYVLQTQGFDRFEKPVVYIDETSFTDYLVDIDGKQGADFIGLDVDVVTQTAGEYMITYEVQDQEGHFLTQEEHYLVLEAGKRRLYLSIPADPFFQKRADGHYLIRFFTVFDENYLSVDSLQSFIYETQAYRYTDFQPFESIRDPQSLGAGSSITTGAAIQNGEVFVWGFRGSAQQGNGKLTVPAHHTRPPK
ncbi:MAG: hypothetical protein LBS40_08380 [Burkholderiales bacterium]|jgi:hypothetical protein|nr:hypothetical protein [Burkholderiales bacterium]